MPVLHSLPLSSPCRSVLMLSEVLGLKLDVKNVDLMNGAHKTPEYLKINPHHSVPTLVDDDGFSVYESRAVLAYLVNKYAPNHALYPSDPKKRALVDMALHFDGSTLYPSMGMVVYPIMRLGAKVDTNLTKILDDNLVLLNEDLGRTPYVAGNELTIADLSILATWTSIESTGFWKLDHLTNVHAWVKRIKDSGKIKNWDELVVATAKQYGDFIKGFMKA